MGPTCRRWAGFSGSPGAAIGSCFAAEAAVMRCACASFAVFEGAVAASVDVEVREEAPASLGVWFFTFGYLQLFDTISFPLRNPLFRCIDFIDKNLHLERC